DARLVLGLEDLRRAIEYRWLWRCHHSVAGSRAPVPSYVPGSRACVHDPDALERELHLLLRAIDHDLLVLESIRLDQERVGLALAHRQVIGAIEQLGPVLVDLEAEGILGGDQ